MGKPQGRGKHEESHYTLDFSALVQPPPTIPQTAPLLPDKNVPKLQKNTLPMKNTTGGETLVPSVTLG